ncbi:hypothetical protein FDG2_5490 [Candidatus Protofrankia californiensis]|uniref:Uncharacterized protein n=1 Tax=Candidatus Protofrankia californiensis TaxID=1839754 RepID=A0A1C3PDY8_9ACTN|nr:hypothetical protein FDG2_5490 [Candidatus Protofrankia californiensis]
MEWENVLAVADVTLGKGSTALTRHEWVPTPRDRLAARVIMDALYDLGGRRDRGALVTTHERLTEALTVIRERLRQDDEHHLRYLMRASEAARRMCADCPPNHDAVAAATDRLLRYRLLIDMIISVAAYEALDHWWVPSAAECSLAVAVTRVITDYSLVGEFDPPMPPHPGNDVWYTQWLHRLHTLPPHVENARTAHADIAPGYLTDAVDVIIRIGTDIQPDASQVITAWRQYPPPSPAGTPAAGNDVLAWEEEQIPTALRDRTEYAEKVFDCAAAVAGRLAYHRFGHGWQERVGIHS